MNKEKYITNNVEFLLVIGKKVQAIQSVFYRLSHDVNNGHIDIKKEDMLKTSKEIVDSVTSDYIILNKDDIVKVLQGDFSAVYNDLYSREIPYSQSNKSVDVIINYFKDCFSQEL